MLYHSVLYTRTQFTTHLSLQWFSTLLSIIYIWFLCSVITFPLPMNILYILYSIIHLSVCQSHWSLEYLNALMDIPSIITTIYCISYCSKFIWIIEWKEVFTFHVAFYLSPLWIIQNIKVFSRNGVYCTTGGNGFFFLSFPLALQFFMKFIFKQPLETYFSYSKHLRI